MSNSQKMGRLLDLKIKEGEEGLCTHRHGENNEADWQVRAKRSASST